MAKNRYAEEQIAFVISKHESGTAIADIVRKMVGSEQRFYLWEKESAGMGVAGLRSLEGLQEENNKLKQLVAGLSLAKKMPQDVALEKCLSGARYGRL
ncbi:MAG: transposase [Planctomycetota bacterium]